MILTMLCAVISCAGQTTYRPSVFGHDYVNGEIVTPYTHERISCFDKKFNSYASFRIDDVKKVALALKYAKLPKDVRIILERIKKDVETHKKIMGLTD